MNTRFAAPWCRTLRISSWGLTLLLTCVAAVLLWENRDATWPVMLASAALPLLAALACALFAVRGYRVEPGVLVIERPLWETRLPLAGLQDARFDTRAMDGSIRLFANGGGFVFAGWFRNRTLGTYRAWVNDPANAVVLRVASKVRVVAPDQPAAFVAAVSAAARRPSY